MSRGRVKTFAQRMTRKSEDALLKVACRIVVRFVHLRIGRDCKISFGMDGQVRVDPLFPDEFESDTQTYSMFSSLKAASVNHLVPFSRRCHACEIWGKGHVGLCRAEPIHDEFGRAR